MRKNEWDKNSWREKKLVLDTVCLAWVWLESVPLTFLS